jgi:superfamily II DNA or RNA helicase
MLGYHHYLTNLGFLLKRDQLDQEEYLAIKRELTFRPIVYQALKSLSKPNSFLTYKESPNYVFVPRFYGTNRFGQPVKNLLPKGDEMADRCRIDASFSVREHQQKAFEATKKQLLEQGGGILSVFCGWGKCLGRDTPVLMADGTSRLVQDVERGDQLMGVDCQPRTVLSTCTGQEDLYEVRPVRSTFASFVCNKSHILSLIYGGSDRNIGGVEWSKGSRHYLTVADLLELPATIRSSLLLHKMDYQRAVGLSSNPNLSPLTRQAIEALEREGAGASEFRLELRSRLGDYYGFTLDQDRLFLLEDLTVMHNTFMAIYLAVQLHGKTLVLVHKEDLFDQWRGEIMSFTGGKASVGVIQQNKIDVDNHDFVLAMLPSMSKREYSINLFKSFRLLIVDECHHIGSEIFSRALDKTAFRYTLGLSATPFRKDGLTTVFTNYLGPIFHIEKRANRLDTLVIRLPLASDSCYYADQYFVNGTRNTAKMVLQLVDFPERNRLITEIIRHLYSTENAPEARKTLILSKSRKHLTLLYELLREMKLRYGERPIMVGYYWGRSPSGENGLRMECSAPIPQIVKRQKKLSFDTSERQYCIFQKEPPSPFCLFHQYLDRQTDEETPLEDYQLCLGRDCHNYFLGEEEKCPVCLGRFQPSEEVSLLESIRKANLKRSSKVKHKEMLEVSKQCDIILGTNDIASEALNIPGLNTLIQATPQQEVEQTVGRILRKQSVDAKNPPLIIDLIDRCGNFVNHSRVRLKTYRSEGFKSINFAKLDLDNQPFEKFNWSLFDQHVREHSFGEKATCESESGSEEDQEDPSKVKCLL